MRWPVYLLQLAIVALAFGCVAGPSPNALPPIRYEALYSEEEYAPFLKTGEGSVSGQAFLKTRGGDVKIGAGNEVTLDPLTAYSYEWWSVAGRYWVRRNILPSVPRFHEIRRAAISDGEGRFVFRDLPDGDYIVRTWVTWEVPQLNYVDNTQGGLVWAAASVRNGGSADVVLTWPEKELPRPATLVVSEVVQP